MKTLFSRIFAVLILVFGVTLAYAQTTAIVTGVVTDSLGAVMPGVTVVLSNSSTGVSYTVKTDTAGSFRVPNVPPGPGYSIEYTYQGFSPYKLNDIYVNVANSTTENAKLSPGSTLEVKVTATGQGVTLNTTDATIGNNFQVSELNNLPVYNRSSPAVLFTLQPGITLTGATTGAREDQTNTTVDGLDVNDFATGNFAAITGNAPVDSVQEFRGTVAGFTADSGPGGGGQFQLITRSGTNEWHGNVNLYHRDNSTTANDWFNDEIGASQPKLVQNQFGGAVGGPIKHDKLFFFFDYLNSRIARDSVQLRIVPLPSFTAGNVSYINNGPGCIFTSRQNTTPGCISSLNPAQVAALDPAGVGESPQILDLFQNLYPAANDLTAGDGVNTGGFRFNSPTPDDLTNYVGRVDWVATDRIKIWGRGTVARENAVNGASGAAQFPGDQPSTQFVDRSYAYVGGMDWQISPYKFNQFIYGNTVQDYSFPRPSNPEGIYQVSFATGTTTLLDSPYSSPTNAQSRRVPIPEVADNFTWIIGRHSLQMGGYFKWILAHDETTLGYNTYTIGLGGNVQGLNASLRPGNLLTPSGTAQVTYDSAFAAMLGRVGAVSSTFNYDAAGNVLPQPSSTVQDFQYYQTQPYIGDTWKVTPALTLTFGVSYQYFSVPYETHGLETVQNQGFDSYFSARQTQSAAGQSGPTAVPLFTYVLGGKANHGPGFYKSHPHEFAPRFAFAYNPGYSPATVFSGSAGIVYDRTIINAVQYQQTQYSYLFAQNQIINNGNADDPVGSLATDPRLANPPTVTPPATPKPPFQPYVDDTGTPYGTQEGVFNEMIDPNLKDPYSILLNFGMQHQFPGQLMFKVSYAGRLGRRLLAQADSSQLIDFPDQASGQLMSQAMGNITAAVRAGADPTNLPPQPWWENQLPPGIAAACTTPQDPTVCANATSFVAYELESLIAKGDFADTIQGLTAAGLLNYNVGMAAQFAENTMYTNKGFSSYNGLLVTLQKNLTHNLQFDFNYTWSHSIDNVSLIANGVAFGGYGFICDAVHPRECRGNSDFDTTNYITGDFTYSLPVGRGRQYASNVPWWLNEVIGGWDISGIPTWHTGEAYSALSSAFVAGFANDAPAIFNGDKGALKHQIHTEQGGAVNLYANPAAAVGAFTGPVGLQIGNRNILRGPNFFNLDAGLAKNFALTPGNRVQLQFRADAFNVLNHPNFDSLTYSNYPNQIDITQPSNFGNLTSLVTTAPGTPRVIQISGRIQF
jgi:hypothetical protein